MNVFEYLDTTGMETSCGRGGLAGLFRWPITESTGKTFACRKLNSSTRIAR